MPTEPLASHSGKDEGTHNNKNNHQNNQTNSTSDMSKNLRCQVCGNFFFSERHSTKLLHGDLFYSYKCIKCARISANSSSSHFNSNNNNPDEVFSRMPMSWTSLIQLVLYHMWVQGGRKHRFFRWKEDICKTIEDRWDDLMPSKKRTPSWTNSVSSVLSANEKIFMTGILEMKNPGWWALQVWEAPQPRVGIVIPIPKKASKKRKAVISNLGLVNIDETTEDEENMEDEIFLSDEENEKDKEKDIEVTVEDESRFKEPEINVNEEKELESSEQKPKMDTASLKQQLLERLLKMDSSLLKAALQKTSIKQAPVIFKTEPKPIIPVKPVKIESEVKKEIKQQQQQQKPVEEEIIVEPLPSVDPVIDVVACSEPETSTEPTIDVSFLQSYQLPANSGNIVRASPYENDLLKRCNRVMPLARNVGRLRRKLLVRRLKRKAGLALFDLDTVLYSYLKATDQHLSMAKKAKLEETMESRESLINTKSENEKRQPITMNLENFNWQECPFVRDPTLSMFVKLNGLSAVLGRSPFEVTSPLTGRVLEPFIYRDFECRAPKLLMMEELRARIKPLRAKCLNYCSFEDDEAEEEEEEEEESLYYPKPSLDYCHIRKEFMGQVNDLLSNAFWPGIDMTESLEYPDHTILVLYRQSVIACAFLTPDAYLTYLYVRPDYSSTGLASTILYFLLTSLHGKKDVTLHVSVTNPALILYQKFGFKPEEFIVNFYEKYFPEDFGEMSRNAFLIRLRR